MVPYQSLFFDHFHVPEKWKWFDQNIVIKTAYQKEILFMQNIAGCVFVTLLSKAHLFKDNYIFSTSVIFTDLGMSKYN